MEIITRKTKNIITKSNLPASDFVINPYIGCFHKCIYCYAEFMQRFANISLPWGEFVVVKEFEAGVKISEKYNGKTILISSVTDPYHSIEKKCQKMRIILPLFFDSKANIEILTKSSLVERDIDLIKKIPNCTVGISLNTLDDSFRKKIEPFASKIEKRVETLKLLHNEGIKNYLFISPIFPELTNVEKLISSTHQFVDYYLCENLNLRGSYKKKVMDMIADNYPEHLSLYQKIYQGKNEIKKKYWEDWKEKIKKIGKIYKKDIKIFFRH